MYYDDEELAIFYHTKSFVDCSPLLVLWGFSMQGRVLTASLQTLVEKSESIEFIY